MRVAIPYINIKNQEQNFFLTFLSTGDIFISFPKDNEVAFDLSADSILSHDFETEEEPIANVCK